MDVINTEKIKTGSALIADFMDVKETKSYYDSSGTSVAHYYTGNKLSRSLSFGVPDKSMSEFLTHAKYHSSWDWLMPVYRKIREDRSKLSKYVLNESDYVVFNIQSSISKVDIQNAFDSIVTYIEWWIAYKNKLTLTTFEMYQDMNGMYVQMNDRFESVHIWNDELALKNKGRWIPMVITKEVYEREQSKLWNKENSET